MATLLIQVHSINVKILKAQNPLCVKRMVNGHLNLFVVSYS